MGDRRAYSSLVKHCISIEEYPSERLAATKMVLNAAGKTWPLQMLLDRNILSEVLLSLSARAALEGPDQLRPLAEEMRKASVAWFRIDLDAAASENNRCKVE